MRIESFTPDLEALFWDVVKRDWCDYYFFIYDWLLQKERTQIFLALEGNEVAGLMVVYDGYIAQLRGEREAVRLLLDHLTLETVDVQVPAYCQDLLLQKFPTSSLKENITLMSLRLGEEQLSVKVQPQRLNAQDAGEIAALMHQSYPNLWGDITAENVVALMGAKEAVWFGIKLGGELVSFGYAMATPKISHVTWIATSPQHGNKGYATSIVSALLKECLAVADGAIIYVVDDNAAAKRVYSKVGFKPYKHYFFVKV